MVSIKDIAIAAQVSESTVSRALRNSPLVNAETKEKVQRVARQFGYRASAVARSLATNRTQTIGVVVTTIADPFAAETVSGIEEAAAEHNFSVFLANSHADPEHELRVITSFQERRVDGVVVTSSRVGTPYAEILAGMKVPIVLINGQHPEPGESVRWVTIGNVAASREATRHLIELGHRRIAYLGDRHGHLFDSERFTGYRQALNDAELPFEPELVVYGDGRPEGGMEAMDVLLRRPPTAVFCFNDFTALGALQRLHNGGLRVPDDISLVGFDDLYMARCAAPPLTTIRQPKQLMGRLAVRTLMDLLAGSSTQSKIEVPGELIVRQSTAAPLRGR